MTTAYETCPTCEAVEWGNALCETCRSHWPGGDPFRTTCDGSSECKAERHLHGCFSDDGTNCDHLSEHAAD